MSVDGTLNHSKPPCRALQNDNINRRQRSSCFARPDTCWKTRFYLRFRCICGNVGAQQVCMNVLPMPGGAQAKVHYHKGIETIAYLLSGECIVFYGDALEHHVMAHAGDQVFVPPNVPHAPCNKSGAPCTWIVVHASGSDQDGIVLLVELDELLSSK